MAKIKILGKGGATYTAESGTISLLFSEKTDTLVFDMSSLTFAYLEESEELEKVNYVFFTHKHADHIGGLMNFIHAVLVRTIPTLSEEPYKRDKISIIGYPGFKEDANTLMRIGIPEYLEGWQPIKLEFKELQDGGAIDFVWGKVEVRLVPHTVSINGLIYKVITHKGSFVFTGDIKPTASVFKTLLDFAEDVDYVFGDMASPLAELSRDVNTLTHPNVEFWREFLKQTKKVKFYPMHLYGVDAQDELISYLTKGNSIAKKRIIFPEKGMEIVL